MLSGRVLPVQALKRSIADGIVTADREIPKANIQPASLDLRFGDVAYRLRASFLSHAGPVADTLPDYAIEELDLTKGLVLEPRRPYLIPLRESVALPEAMRGFVNPKSSAGRVDTLCRALTDGSDAFDQIRPGYQGPLYVEIVSRTFPLLIRPDTTMVQLRLFRGEDPFLTDDELARLHDEIGLMSDFETELLAPPSLDNGLGLSLDLRGDENGIVGYRAKRNTEVLDYGKLGQEWRRFWEPVYRDVDSPRLVLEPEEFYLLLSQEAITIPPSLAAEMVPYDVRSGEVRTHYAGFFDPGFGYRADKRGWGSRATLEVRAHDVPFVVEQGQRVCWMVYCHMDEAPDFLYGTEISSNYQGQINTLSKHFVRPVSEPEDRQLALLR
ncbi:MAG: 2'-deoxycytidine 5'-triphosphate deaminase [Acidimicrobiales bacterium]|nr:2'-deoxycytidine 5'-triphosphate deaminase [Acidimicrobiales bacterium]HRW38610.1 2'-deoxycytidine 5'-triphosphate deaminase [Aquihabitans sp.]